MSENDQIQLGRNGYVKTQEIEGWVIAYYQTRNGSLFADFWRVPVNVRITPWAVSDYYCGICKADAFHPCQHMHALLEHAPGMLSDAELDNEDAWEDWRGHQETIRAGLRGLA